MNRFAGAVSSVPDIASGYRQGLGALGSDSKHVSAADNRLIYGSVDIDGCTMEKYPTAPRWDYVLSYNNRAFFLEVHPATDGEVKEMAAKLEWLKNWLLQEATALNNYPAGTPKFTWVHSGRCGLTKGSSEYRRAAMLGLLPRKTLVLK